MRDVAKQPWNASLTTKVTSAIQSLCSMATLVWGSVPLGLREALVVYFTWRVPLILLLTFAQGNLPPGPAAHSSALEGLDSPLIAWHRWDSGWYVWIIRHGYGFIRPGSGNCQSSIAFFPLFPMLSRGLSRLGVPILLADVLIANVATVFALWGLWGLARRFVPGEDGPRRALIALLVFPTSIFLSAAYTESLLLAFGTWAVLFFERRRALPCALCAGAAAIARANGILLVASLCVAAALRRQWMVLGLVTICAGATLGGFCYYQRVRFGDPLAFLHARECWGVVTSHPAEALRSYVDGAVGGHQFEPWLDVLTAAWLVVASVPIFARLGVVYGLFTLGTVMATVQSGQLWGMARIGMCAFPVYILLAQWTRRPRVALVLAFTGLSLLSMEGYRFVNGYWVSELRSPRISYPAFSIC